MKAITKYLMMMIAMLAMSVSLSSCRETEDPVLVPEPEFTLKGTTWSFNEKFEETEDGEVVKYEYEYVLDFSSKEVTFTENIKATYKNESQMYSNHYDYTYTYSDNLVIMKPVDANLYNLEGTIISKIKMRVVNSDGDEIGTFYLED